MSPGTDSAVDEPAPNPSCRVRRRREPILDRQQRSKHFLVKYGGVQIVYASPRGQVVFSESFGIGFRIHNGFLRRSPAFGSPNLEIFAGPHDESLAIDSGVVSEKIGQKYATRGIERHFCCASKKDPLYRARPRIGGGECRSLLGQLVEAVRRVDVALAANKRPSRS